MSFAVQATCARKVSYSDASWSSSADLYEQKSKNEEEKNQRTFQLGKTVVDLITFLEHSLTMFPEPCDESQWLSSLREEILAGPNEFLEVSKVLWRHMWIGSSFVQTPDRLALIGDLRSLKAIVVDRLELFANRFILGVELGAGGFGRVNRAEDVATNKIVAIKSTCKRESETLKREVDAYSRLKGGEGIPRMYDYSINGDCNYLAMDLLGDSLHVLFESHKRAFTSKTILMIAIKMIRIVEFVHSRGLIHGDIKPDNFAIGLGQAANEVFLIDFGISQQHPACPHDKIPRFQGTPLFASLNAHKGWGLSPHDDLESIGYTLLYFFKGGCLPWASFLSQSGLGRTEKRLQIEMFKTVFQGTYGDMMNCPTSLATYLDSCHSLDLHDKPDYNKLLSLFLDNLENDGFSCNFDDFDWMRGRLESEKAKWCFRDADCYRSGEPPEHRRPRRPLNDPPKRRRPLYARLRLPPVPSELPRLGLRSGNANPCSCSQPGETKTPKSTFLKICQDAAKVEHEYEHVAL